MQQIIAMSQYLQIRCQGQRSFFSLKNKKTKKKSNHILPPFLSNLTTNAVSVEGADLFDLITHQFPKSHFKFERREIHVLQ